MNPSWPGIGLSSHFMTAGGLSSPVSSQRSPKLQGDHFKTKFVNQVKNDTYISGRKFKMTFKNNVQMNQTLDFKHSEFDGSKLTNKSREE